MLGVLKKLAIIYKECLGVKSGAEDETNKDSSNLAEKIINTYNYVES